MSNSKKSRSQLIFCLASPARLISWFRSKRSSNKTCSAISINRNYSLRFDRSSVSGDEDFAELIRVAAEEKAVKELKVMRSQSMAVCRIDEEAPCEFNESDFDVGMFLRSKSYAVSNVQQIGPKNRYRYS